MAQDICRAEVPPLFEVERAEADQEAGARTSACFFWRECLDG
jgi:oligopeptide transport system ATP-binding protein